MPAAGEPGGPPAPDYTEFDGAGGGGAGRAYEDPTTPGFSATQASRDTYPDYRYRRGEEDGALADKQGLPRPMREDEVRRINEERRKRMKAGGFTNWVLRRKGRSGKGDTVVR